MTYFLNPQDAWFSIMWPIYGREFHSALIDDSGPHAGMILVEGNPLEHVSPLTDYDNTIKVVIKDGEV